MSRRAITIYIEFKSRERPRKRTDLVKWIKGVSCHMLTTYFIKISVSLTDDSGFSSDDSKMN